MWARDVAGFAVAAVDDPVSDGQRIVIVGPAMASKQPRMTSSAG
jgi:uncharacterized protein YbjT (DUF2867 family)